MDELEIEEFEDDFEIDDSFEQLPKPTSATLAEDPDAGLAEKKSSHSHSDDHLTFADFADSSGSGARGGGMLAGGGSKGSSGAAGGGAGPGLFIDNPFTFNDDDTTNKMRSVGKVETPHFSPIESPSEGHAAPEPQGNTNSRTSNQGANAQDAAMPMPDFLKGLSDDEVDSEEEGAALFGIGIGTAGAAAATTKKDVRPEVAGGGSPTSPAQPPRASAAVGDSFVGDVEIGGEQEQVEDFSSAAPSGGPPHPAPGVKSSGLLKNDIDVDALLKSSSSQDEGLFAHLHKQEKVADRAEPAAPVNSNEFETASGASSSGTGTTGGRGRRPRGVSIGEKEDGAVDPLDAALFGAAAGAATASASATTGSGTAAGAGAATDEIEGHDHQNSHHPNSSSSSSANKRKSAAGGPLLARSPTSRDMQAASNTMDSDDSDAELFKGVAVSNKKKPPVARAQTQRQMSSLGPGSDDLSEERSGSAAGAGSERNAGPVTIGSVDDADLFTLGPPAGTASSGATPGGAAAGQGGPPTPPIMKLSKNEENTAAPALTTAPVIGSVHDADLFTLGPGPAVGGAAAASVDGGAVKAAGPPEATPGAGAVGEEIDFTSLLKQKPKRKFQAAAPAAVEEPARGPRAQPSSTTSASTLCAGVAVVAGGVAGGAAAAAAGASGASTASSGASPADQQKGPAASAPRPGSSSPGGRQFVEKIGGGVNYMQPYNPEMGNANKPRVHGPGMPPPLVSETTTTSSEAYTIQDEERPAATDESAPPAIGAHLPKHGEDVIREEIEASGETKLGTYDAAGRARGSKGSSSRAKPEKEIENAARGASTGGGAATRAAPGARRTTSKDRQGAAVPQVAAGSGTAGGAAGGKKAGILKKDNAAGGRVAPGVQAQSAGGAARPREQTDAKKIEARLSTPPADEGGGGASASGASLASMGYSEDFEVYSDDFEQEQFAVAVAGKPKERTPAPGAATANKGRSSTVGVPGSGQQQRSSNDARSNSRTVTVVSSRVPGHSRKGILNIAGEKGVLPTAPPQPHVKRTRPGVRNAGGGTEQPGVILTAENARDVLRVVRGRKTVQRGAKNEGRPTSSSSTNDDDGASIESVSKESTAAPSRQKSPVDPNKKSPTDTNINVDNVDPAWLPPQYREVAVKVMATCNEEGYQSSPPRSRSPPAARPGTSSVRNRNRLKAAAGGTHDEQQGVLGEQQAEVGGAGSASPGKSKPAPPVGGASSAAATSRKKRSTGPAPAGAAASSSSGGGDPHHRQRGEEDGASDAEDAEQLNSVSLGGAASQGTSSKGEAYASDYRPPGSALTSNRSPTRQGTRGGGSNRQVPDFIRVQKRIDKARKEHVLAELQQMLNETWRHDKNLKMRALKNEWNQQRVEQQKHQEEQRMRRIREIEAERQNYVEKQLRDRQNYLRRKEEDRKRKELEQKRFSLLQRVYDEGLRKEKLKELEKEREKHREKFKKKIKFVMPQWID